MTLNLNFNIISRNLDSLYYCYAVALIRKYEQKYPDLGCAIVATEVQGASGKIRVSVDEDDQNKNNKIDENIKYSKAHGVQNIDSEDAQIANLVAKYKADGNHFRRIHFNFPHNGKHYQKGGGNASAEGLFEKVIMLQIIGDRIHIALPSSCTIITWCCSTLL